MLNVEIIAERYRIEEHVATGGMSYIYRAYDQAADRIVAIKMMKPEMASEATSRIRFIREGEATANLNHPNIIGVYDIGEYQTLPYMVMEYVTGVSLADQLKARLPFNPIEALDIMMQLMQALQYAHMHDIIHRDIKPNNILLTANNTVKLIDFGIALVAEQARITEAYAFFGSLYYISPEIIIGRQPSVQSDIYAAGVTFFELLTGHAPYEGEQMAAIMSNIANKPFPKVRRINRHVPVYVERIINKACAKHPEDRYESALAMYHDLYQARYEKTPKLPWYKRLFKRG